VSDPPRLIDAGRMAPLLHEYRKQTAAPAPVASIDRSPPAGWQLVPTLIGGLLAACLGVWLTARAPGTGEPGGAGGADGRSGSVPGNAGASGARGT
jgi:hypothetical protein